MRFVPIQYIEENSILAKSIYDFNGRILLKDGTRLSKNLINRIKSMGIYSLYVNDNYSDSELEDIIKPEVKQDCIKSIKNTFEQLNNSNSYIPTNRNLVLKQKEDKHNEIKIVAEKILDEILSKKNIVINIIDIKNINNYVYQHCINVAVLSLVLGIHLQIKKSDLYNLCLGAILHDIGKVLIPQEIVYKKTDLTPEETKILKTHALEGYTYFKDSYSMPSPAKIIILHHHERIDGKGYPKGLTDTKINYLAKIVAIADIYDELTSDKPNRKAISANEAIEYILANGGTHFDYDMVKTFVSAIIPYPEGTLVELSSSDIAVVEHAHTNFPLRPKVKIIKSNNTDNINKSIELMQELNLVIKGIVYNI